VSSVPVHAITIVTQPDIRGVVHHAKCQCGWRGECRVGTPGASDPGRKTAELDGTFHLRDEVDASAAQGMRKATPDA
jgi:hypothetical protein